MKSEKVLSLKNGEQLAYTEYEGTGTPIILIHGFPLNQKIWKAQVDELVKAGKRVITYDMRGFGKSSDPKGLYSHEDDLAELLNELNIAECHLVGMSFGGEIATSFAIANPSMVKELTLIGSGINGYVASEQSPFAKWADMVKEGKIDEVIQQLLVHGELGDMASTKPELYAEISAVIKEWNGSMFFKGCKRVTPVPPTIESLAEVKCPTTVIVGENDTKDSLAQSKILAESIQGATTIISPETGHFVNMEVPGIVSKSLLKSEIKAERELTSVADEETVGIKLV